VIQRCKHSQEAFPALLLPLFDLQFVSLLSLTSVILVFPLHQLFWRKYVNSSTSQSSFCPSGTGETRLHGQLNPTWKGANNKNGRTAESRKTPTGIEPGAGPAGTEQVGTASPAQVTRRKAPSALDGTSQVSKPGSHCVTGIMAVNHEQERQVLHLQRCLSQDASE